ncbi:MAG TPA: protein kinase [Kofleriaceae bacterium]|nr:protein kinase [Kofleriaceae bacterium]
MIEGSTIGQYRVIRKIGEGGMGAVYEAQHTLIGRRAAIKVLLPELSSHREIVDRFFNEARATTSISDPGIVQVFDFGVHTDNSAFIVMEFLEGEPVDSRMKRFGRLTPFDALRITRQCAGSLAAAHQRGIVHRDLKPENIFLVKDQEAQGGERAKILDFGIAKLSNNESSTKTRTGMMMGTPVYMSPEQCRGAGSVDHRSDIYSMGCVLYHMLTGRPPFDAEGMGELIAMHLREQPKPPSELVQGINIVDEVVLTCLAKDPAQRLQTMTDLQRACDAVMARITNSGASAQTVALATPVPPGFRSEFPQAAAAPLQPATQVLGKPTTLSAATGEAGTTPPTPRRRVGLFAGIGVLVAGGIVAAVVMAGGSKPKPESGTAATPGSNAAPVTAVPADAPAVVTAVPPDAAPVAPPDAAEIATSPPDAGTTAAAVVTTPVKDPKRPKKPTTTKPNTGSASGGNLYDNR